MKAYLFSIFHYFPLLHTFFLQGNPKKDINSFKSFTFEAFIEFKLQKKVKSHFFIPFVTLLENISIHSESHFKNIFLYF